MVLKSHSPSLQTRVNVQLLTWETKCSVLLQVDQTQRSYPTFFEGYLSEYTFLD